MFPELVERQEIRTVRATGPKMLEAAVQRYERSGGEHVNSAVVFAVPEAFFPKFDDNNEALRKCCDKSFESECGVGGEKGHAEVEGRAELCDFLKVRALVVSDNDALSGMSALFWCGRGCLQQQQQQQLLHSLCD